MILSYSRKDCIGPEQDFPEFPLQDKGQSGWTKGSETRPIPSWKRDRLLDLRLLPGHWRQWIRTRLFRLVYGCYSEWQHSGVRYEMRWNLIVNGASLYKLRIRGSKKLKIVLELYNVEIHRKKAKPDYHRLKTIVKKKELSNIWGHETARLEMGRLSQTSWSRIKGDNVVFTKDKENVCNGRSAGSVRNETKFSFRHDGDECATPTPPCSSSRTFDAARCNKI